LTLGYFELNPLTLFQCFKTVTNNGSEVDKNVRTLILLNKTKAFVGIEPLNGSCSCSHNINLQFKQKKPFRAELHPERVISRKCRYYFDEGTNYLEKDRDYRQKATLYFKLEQI